MFRCCSWFIIRGLNYERFVNICLCLCLPIFKPAAGLSAVFASWAAVPATACGGLPPVATARWPSLSPTSAHAAAIPAGRGSNISAFGHHFKFATHFQITLIFCYTVQYTFKECGFFSAFSNILSNLFEILLQNAVNFQNTLIISNQIQHTFKTFGRYFTKCS